MGPFATWDMIAKISAAIPCLRKVKDHLEAELNHFRRGKSHTSPDKEQDIVKLQTAYHLAKAHEYQPGRTIAEKDKFSDYTAQGTDLTKLSKVISHWLERRISERSTNQEFNSVR